MNSNIYKVISAAGDICEAEDYLASAACSPDFRVAIEREALGVQAPMKSEAPAYLEPAQKFWFSWEQKASKGLLNYNYKASWMMRQLSEYARLLVGEIGIPIYEVRGANMFQLDHDSVAAKLAEISR